jgi:hypothetical protein
MNEPDATLAPLDVAIQRTANAYRLTGDISCTFAFEVTDWWPALRRNGLFALLFAGLPVAFRFMSTALMSDGVASLRPTPGLWIDGGTAALTLGSLVAIACLPWRLGRMAVHVRTADGDVLASAVQRPGTRSCIFEAHTDTLRGEIRDTAAGLVFASSHGQQVIAEAEADTGDRSEPDVHLVGRTLTNQLVPSPLRAFAHFGPPRYFWVRAQSSGGRVRVRAGHGSRGHYIDIASVHDAGELVPASLLLVAVAFHMQHRWPNYFTRIDKRVIGERKRRISLPRRE